MIAEDRFDVRRVLRPRPELRAFNEAGVLAAADVHVAARLLALAGEDDPDVALAAALAVRAPRPGCCARSTTPECSPRPTSTSPAG